MTKVLTTLLFVFYVVFVIKLFLHYQNKISRIDINSKKDKPVLRKIQKEYMKYGMLAVFSFLILFLIMAAVANVLT